MGLFVGADSDMLGLTACSCMGGIKPRSWAATGIVARVATIVTIETTETVEAKIFTGGSPVGECRKLLRRASCCLLADAALPDLTARRFVGNVDWERGPS